MKENLLTELKIEIENTIIQFENIFMNYNGDFEKFVKENYQPFKNKIAKSTTDIIHKSIINNLSKDKDFLAEILKLNSESFQILIFRLSKN